MKNYRSTQYQRLKQEEKNKKMGSIDQKTYSPNNRHLQTRLVQYQHLAKQAKQQLKQLENRRKNSPQNNKYPYLVQELANKYPTETLAPNTLRQGEHTKQLQHGYSQKYFKKQNNLKDGNIQNKEIKVRSTNKQQNKSTDKQTLETKLHSPKKKPFLDSNQYKKLHEKLDSIENKITDMKKNLQKKKQEKQKLIDNKGKKEYQLQFNQQKKISLKGLVTQVPQHTELHSFNSNPYSPRHNVYYVSEMVRAYMDQRSLARQHLTTSLNILKMLEKSKRMNEEEIKKVKLNLPKRKGYEDKKTIIFDLDETLIHCNDSLNPPYDVKLTIKFPTGQLVDAGINIRPYSRDILKNLSKYFEIIIFTASHSCYANVVVDYLDPNNEWVHHRLYREHCFLSNENLYVKDLRIINRDPKDMVLVDNAAYSYAFQLQNGIPILPYYHGQIDFQLRALEEYLMRLAFTKDMREANQNTFKLTQYKFYYNKLEKLVQDLYINNK